MVLISLRTSRVSNGFRGRDVKSIYMGEDSLLSSPGKRNAMSSPPDKVSLLTNLS